VTRKQKILSVILWLAKILGAVVIVFLLYMTFGELFSTGTKTVMLKDSDIVALIFFPISTIIGLLVAYKWQGTGGLITVGGIISLHIVRPDLASSLLISAFAIPGLLYIIYAVWRRRDTNLH
jgi:hypothetical protein